MDRTSKIILAAIAVGLFANAFATLVRPASASAATELRCTGKLKANAWGGVEAHLGGYDVELKCEE